MKHVKKLFTNYGTNNTVL